MYRWGSRDCAALGPHTANTQMDTITQNNILSQEISQLRIDYSPLILFWAPSCLHLVARSVHGWGHASERSGWEGTLHDRKPTTHVGLHHSLNDPTTWGYCNLVHIT